MPRFPAAVALFLRDNPGYTKKFAASGLAPERAYFQLRVMKDWEELRPHLPAKIKTALDIGCGIAGIDLLIHRRLGAPRLFLVDKSRREQEDRTYDVVALARRFLIANGVPAGKVQTLSSQADDLHEKLRRSKYDLILSLRGLGYMFPYEVYRETLSTVLAARGRLIMDVRLMDADKLKSSPVIFERFRKAGLPTEKKVFAQLRKDFGDVLEIGRSADYARILIGSR